VLFPGYNDIVKFIFTVFSIFLLFLSSCSTMNNRRLASIAGDVSTRLVSGNTDDLAAESGIPFLFETEILPAPAQLTALWEGLAASGYDFSASGEITVMDADDETRRRFSTSREVEVWFQRHAPPEAALAVVPMTDGRLLLIIDRNRRSIRPLKGLKVEQE